MTTNDPQPQELFGKELDAIRDVYALGTWWTIEDPVIERGNLRFVIRNVSYLFPLKEVRGIRW